MESQKENNSSATELKGTECCNLTDKEFKIAGINNSKSYKKTQKRFNEI